MTEQTRPVSPLRQRMLEDMRMRKMSPKMLIGYVRAVKRFAKYLKRSPDTATAEELRQFQLHSLDHGMSGITLNVTITGLKFFFEVILGRPELMAKMQPVAVPRRLPVVLSVDEASQLIAATNGLKYRAAFSIAYGAGLRASEVVGLRVGDIDSQRMMLRVDQG